jgi:hypothetical protein
MKTLTRLTLTTVAVLTFGATTLLAGPGPIGPTRHPARLYPPPVKEATCERMVVNKPAKLGGPEFVKCTTVVKDTVTCRLACR